MSQVNNPNEFDDTFTSQKNKYLDYTHRLNDYNEIYNLNHYLSDSTQMDLDRLNSINETLKTRVLRMKQEYLMYEFGLNQYTFRVNLLYFLIICLSIVLFSVTMFSEQRMPLMTTIIIASVVLLVCLIVVLWAVIANKSRRSYAYNQYYWQEVASKK